MFGGAWRDHSCVPSVESALGYGSGMMITGYIQQRDGLKGGCGVISSNHNKGRAVGPSRLGEWRKKKKRLLCGKSSRCHCTCRPKQCHWSPPHTLPFYLFMGNKKYGEVNAGVSKPRHGRLYEVFTLGYNGDTRGNIHDLAVFGDNY